VIFDLGARGDLPEAQSRRVCTAASQAAIPARTASEAATLAPASTMEVSRSDAMTGSG
jgi:hypothetical protein